MASEEPDLIEVAKDVLCAPHLELVCSCARTGSCGGCKVMKLARAWTKAFGERPCKHLQTMAVGLVSDPVQRCLECRTIL